MTGFKNGVLCCLGDESRKNIGDYIQSIAAAQFAGPDAVRVEREHLDEYAGGPTRVAMNAWFMHHPDRFPPSSDIIPLFVSFHLLPKIEKRFFTEKTVAYLKAREPIGCRSTDIVEMLEKHGIKGEFTSCVTLTLGESYRHREEDSAPVFVDPDFRRFKRDAAWSVVPRFISLLPRMLTHPLAVLRLARQFKVFEYWPRNRFFMVRLVYAAEFLRTYSSLFGYDVLLGAEYITHKVPKRDYPDDEALLAKADSLLHRYERAPFVVTSRLHCALPCVAMGTPVWTVVRPKLKRGRFGGNEMFMNMLDFGADGRVRSPVAPQSADGKFHLCDRPPVKTAHLKYANALAARCRAFFSGQKCYAAMASDDVRSASSSGGAFTLFAREILSRGGAVCGAAFDEAFRCRYVIAESEPELAPLRGSKYVKAALTPDFLRRVREILEAGRQVLFVGTPCHVAAARRIFSGFSNSLFTLDLICAGCPGQSLFDRYLDENWGRENIAKYEFRSKARGWRHHHYLLHIVLKDGREIWREKGEDEYMTAMSTGIGVPDGCYRCPFCSMDRQGDITLGDFWMVPEEMDDGKGTSALLVNTEKGRMLFDAVRAKFARLAEYPPSELESRQARLRSPRTVHPAREAFLTRVNRPGVTVADAAPAALASVQPQK